MGPEPEYIFFSDPQSWVEAAADLFLDSARQSLSNRGIFTVALSGGQTPQPLYERLSLPSCRMEVPWKSVHFFWGDERCVPVNDPDSNYGTGQRSFISALPIPRENVHPIPLLGKNCSSSAAQYEKELFLFFHGLRFRNKTPVEIPNPLDPPGFDLILLGLGADGHTASLFPGSPALEEKYHWTSFVPRSPQPPRVSRVTLTLPVINKARLVLFLVSGTDKREIVGKIIREWKKPDSPYPAARVRPVGKLIWLFLETGRIDREQK